jgi:hypothetical protein
LKKTNDFNNNESYYDLFDDWDLIESSFWKQYGIRLRSDDDLTWPEFSSLLSGLMHDTPLGSVVAIRAESDSKVIKNFSKDQKRIRSEWILKRNAKLMEDPVAYNQYWEKMQEAFKSAFSVDK